MDDTWIHKRVILACFLANPSFVIEYYFDFFFTVSSMILVGVARGYQIVMDCQDKWPHCWPLFPIVTVTTAPLQTIFRQSLNILLSSLKQNPSLDVEPWPGPITAEIEVRQTHWGCNWQTDRKWGRTIWWQESWANALNIMEVCIYESLYNESDWM